jgi:hypothetical protein
VSHTEDLLRGLKAVLVAGGVTDTIVFGELPSTPDRCIALSAYAAQDEATVALSHRRVQAMVRGAQNSYLDAEGLADDVFDILHGLVDRTFGVVHLVQCFRISAVPLGIDGSKRSTRADNYEIDVDLPLTAARDF